MKNIFSANEQAPEIDPAFQQQVPANLVNAPTTPYGLPAAVHVPLAPRFEDLAARTHPESATKADPYTWRRGR